MILLLLLLLFIYINIDTSIAGISSPYFVATFFGGFLLLKNIKGIVSGYYKWLIFMLLIIFSTIVSFVKFGPNYSILPSLIQSLISIVIGYAAFIEIQKNSYRVSKVFNIIIIVLLTVVFLEVFFSPFQSFSDLIRDTIYSGGKYINDQRDIEQFGFIRPKAFSREPSFITGFFAYLVIPYYCFSKNRLNALRNSLLYGFVLLVLSFSIKALIPLFIILVLHYSNKLLVLKISQSFQILVLGAILVYISFYFFKDRIMNIIAGQDLSSFIRINIPAILSYKVLLNDPLFGWGFANKEVIESEIIRNVFQFYEWIKANSENLSGLNNYFFGTIIYFGILGTIVVMYSIVNILGRLPVNVKLLCILLIFILGFTQGGWITLKFWVRFYIILASFKYFFESQFNK